MQHCKRTRNPFVYNAVRRVFRRRQDLNALIRRRVFGFEVMELRLALSTVHQVDAEQGIQGLQDAVDTAEPGDVVLAFGC